MRSTLSLVTIGIAAIVAMPACTVKDVNEPAFTGPSTFATSIQLSSSTDTLIQDGASQAIISIKAVDAQGTPKNIPLRAEIRVDNIPQDYGRLSTKQPIANGSPLIYTAPPPSAIPTAQSAQTVQIVVTPTDGFDFANEVPRAVDIRLVPQGVILPTNPNLIADFTASTFTPEAFRSVTFDATASTIVVPPSTTKVACTTACTYSWNFGDGTTGAGITATHAFRAPGTFAVTLTVTDSRGAQASTSKTVTASTPAAPGGDFTLSPSSNIATNVDVAFNAAGVTWSGRTISSYSWNFGDGERGSGITTTHRFRGAGTFTVTLTVADDLGATGQLSKTVTVTTLGGVTAGLSASTTAPKVNQRVVFDATTSVPSAGGTIVSYRFIYGDGAEETSDGGIQSHTYTSTGSFTVTVVVTDSNGKTASKSLTLTVS